MAQERVNPEQLKVTLISPYAMEGVEGGVQENIRQTSHHLENLGHITTVFAPRIKGIVEDPTILPLGEANKRTFRCSVSYTALKPIAPWSINRMLRENPADIRHFHEPEISSPSLQMLWVSKDTNIVTFHLYDDPGKTHRVVSLLKYIYGGRIHGRIAVSEATKNLAKDLFPGEYEVIPNGVDCNQFSPDNPKISRYMDGRVNILYVGRLEGRKGVHHLINAYDQSGLDDENGRLIVVGEGPQKDDLRSLAGNLKLANIEFAGRVPADELPSYYSSSHIASSPATHGESFGIVILQGMASRLPVIVGDNPGYRTLVDDSVGILTDPRDTEKFSFWLKYLARNPEIRKNLAEKGYQRAQQYDWPIVTKQLVDYYYSKLAPSF